MSHHHWRGWGCKIGISRFRTEPEIYMPLSQHPLNADEVQVAVRSSMPEGAITSVLRERVHARIPEAAVKFTTMRENALGFRGDAPFSHIADERFLRACSAACRGRGVWGMSYITAERTAELGVRLALGASRGIVMALLLGRRARCLRLGLRSGLWGPSRVALASLGAAALPAWRAGRVDPVQAIRND